MSETPAGERARVSARALAARAGQVAFAQRSTYRRRTLLRRLTGGRLGRAAPEVLELDSPWQDTLSFERGSEGWRARTANLDGEEAFGVDYYLCRRCRAGWVEQPFTFPPYQRPTPRECPGGTLAERRYIRPPCWTDCGEVGPREPVAGGRDLHTCRRQQLGLTQGPQIEGWRRPLQPARAATWADPALVAVRAASTISGGWRVFRSR